MMVRAELGLCSVASSTRISTRSAASRFDSGSSNRKSCGSRTIARPIATRWRWPPESSRGRRCQQVLDLQRCAAAALTRARRSPVSAGAARLQPEGHVLVDGHVRIERVALEHHGDAALGRLRRRSRSAPSMAIVPSVTSSRPAIIRSSVDLPQPDGPTKTQNSPSRDGEVDAVQDRDRRSSCGLPVSSRSAMTFLHRRSSRSPNSTSSSPSSRWSPASSSGPAARLPRVRSCRGDAASPWSSPCGTPPGS